MLSSSSKWVALGLLVLGVNGGGGAHKPQQVTVVDTKTIYTSTTVPVTHYVDVTKTHYVTVTISKTSTACFTESTTTTLHYTVSTTKTDTQTTTKTDTETTTVTVPATVTSYTTTTLLFTTVDPCPSTCSISAGTVTVFFWPTDRPYTYPSTYVNTALDYTFTSPSVYMLIDTARGTNTAGPAGPSTKSWILPLNLDEVSTIISGSITRQLTLSDLGTDCPQTADPTAIATMTPDSRCNPILAAPKKVSSWAYPCNACGPFGLFDPPYAVPTLTGGLVPTPTPPPVVTTPAPAPTSTQRPASTTRAAPVTPVPASATRVMGGLQGVSLILSVLVAAFLF